MPNYQYPMRFGRAFKANNHSDSLPFSNKIMMRDVMASELKDAILE
jgi:hypothetical protein